MRYVKSPIQLIIRSQKPLEWGIPDDSRIKVEIGTFPRETLYTQGDVFIFPEKFNGLSLPLQEAYASGMLVCSSNRFPMNTWLPNENLIQVKESRKNRIGPAYFEYEEAIIDPQLVAEKIDEIYQLDELSIRKYSSWGIHWGKQLSWEFSKPRYLNLLRDLVRGVQDGGYQRQTDSPIG
jgi:glycosyltransferase involved in cell wall biosynthesis